jgi:SAM-dependent methyltransferase
MFLRHLGFRAEGLDYSEELVGRLWREYPEVSWTVSDVRSMPYADGMFDGVISLGVVEHDQAGPLAALREVHRVLRPGGVAIITVPCDRPRQRSSSARQFPPKNGGSFFQYFMTEEELAAYMREAGFEPLAMGLLRLPSLALLSPALFMRLPRKVNALVALAVQLLFRWTDRFDGITYCAGRR